MYPYITPPSWQTALASVDKPSDSTDDDETTDDQNPIIALVKGPKRVGKSSFARSALNRLLRRYKKVAWLECDLGQGEFGCGGIVGIWIVDQPVLGTPDLSMLQTMLRIPGPPFTHSRLPDVAHYLGTYAPLTCPDEYIAAIRHVLTFYRYQLQYPTGASSSDVVPLIINTQGWVKGLGEDLLRAIEESTEPTHIFNFESPSEEENAHPAGGGWTNSPPAHANGLPFVDSFAPLDNRSSPRAIQYILECAPTSPLQARYTSADLRILSLMTYLHFDFSSSKWNFSIPLLAMHPWQIEVGSSIEHIILIGEGADGVVEEDLTLALNGSMVALLETTEPLVGPAYVQGRSYPAFNDSNFLGLALVRDAVVSPTALKLHLLSPVPPAQLSKARILVKNGALELPLCGMIDWRSGGMSEDGLVGMKWEDVPFLDVAGVEVAGGERRRFRRNLMRKGM